MKLFTCVALACMVTLSYGQYNYQEVLGKSLLFYEAQRSGKLPSDNRIDWRGDSALEDEVPGGYYDAGDHVKFGFPMAAMTTQIAWGAITFKDGYENAGEIDNLTKMLKWSTDYFLACIKGPNEFIGQIGDGDADHSYWGRPEDMTMNRPASSIKNNGADLAGETAAALAAASIYYQSIGDSAAGDAALDGAKTLFEFADAHRTPYTNDISGAGNFYNSWSGVGDELIWSAAWMYKATKDNNYLQKATAFFDEYDTGKVEEFGWDNKFAGARVLLYEATSDSKYSDAFNEFANYVLYEAQYTPKGLVYIDQWGDLRHAANIAHLFAQAKELNMGDASELESFIKTQMNYILGDTGRSYVVGYGTNPPQRPHHRSSSCPDMPEPCDWDDFNNNGPNPQTLNGALVGGPDANDNYNDDRGDYVKNEVATDYNAGFQSALAYLSRN